MRKTDTLDTKGILRLIQSIPSKKAEPLKLWLAQVGKERIDEAYDPEIAINRAIDLYTNEKKSWQKLVKRVMNLDVSWEEPAKKYLKIYKMKKNFDTDSILHF